jgi:putative ABC transport system permease protein
MMETLLQDLRYAIRMVAKSPGYTAVIVLALAVGIGATTAIFSVVNAILLRALPYGNPDRIVMVWMDNRKLAVDQDWHSYPNYSDYKDQNQVFEEMAAFNDRSFNLTGTGDPDRVVGAHSTASLFAVLGVEPIQGRVFMPEENDPGKDQVVIISQGLWQRRYGSDPNLVGQQISVNGASRTVVGIMPASFRFPSKNSEIWVPTSLNPEIKAQRSAFWLKAVGKLKPGVTIEQARADMTPIASRLAEQYDFLSAYGVNLVPLHDQIVGTVRPALLVLLGAVGFVLLIACANVANLLLARAAVREREIAIRTALGAGRWRLVRQLLTESTLLAIVGGTAGLLIALWGLDVLVALSPADIPRLDQIRIDGRVLAFTFSVSLLTGLIFGIVPAIQSSKPDLNESLKEGGRGTTGGIQGARVRSALVVSEIALSLVLLIGAGLMIKSFIRLQQFDMGFNPERLLTMRLQLSGTKYREEQPRVSFIKDLVERVESLPGIQSAGAISTIFLTKTPFSTTFRIKGRPAPPPEEDIEVPIDSVTPNYFRVMGIPLISGREFNDGDVRTAPGAIIINQTFVRQFFKDEDPIGKDFTFGDPNTDPWLKIVGVVADVRRTGFDSEPRAETFLPHAQASSGAMTLVIRTAGDPVSLASAIRSEVWAIDKDQAVYDIKPMSQLLGDMISQRRFNMLLLAIFSAVALILAAVGIYGVISYSVTQRTHEIGIRIALGARPGDVLKMVVGRAALLALVGVGTGILGAFALTRLMSSLLYGVSATDPLTFGVVSLALSGVALGASFVPALRAARVDPMIALRYE